MDNGKVFKNRGEILGLHSYYSTWPTIVNSSRPWVGREVGGGRGDFEGTEMKNFQMPSEIICEYEVSFKLGNGKGFKNKGKIRERNQLTH